MCLPLKYLPKGTIKCNSFRIQMSSVVVADIFGYKRLFRVGVRKRSIFFYTRLTKERKTNQFMPGPVIVEKYTNSSPFSYSNTTLRNIKIPASLFLINVVDVASDNSRNKQHFLFFIYVNKKIIENICSCSISIRDFG